MKLVIYTPSVTVAVFTKQQASLICIRQAKVIFCSWQPMWTASCKIFILLIYLKLYINKT